MPLIPNNPYSLSETMFLNVHSFGLIKICIVFIKSLTKKYFFYQETCKIMNNLCIDEEKFNS